MALILQAVFLKLVFVVYKFIFYTVIWKTSKFTGFYVLLLYVIAFELLNVLVDFKELNEHIYKCGYYMAFSISVLIGLYNVYKFIKNRNDAYS